MKSIAVFAGSGFDHVAPLDASHGRELSRRFVTDFLESDNVKCVEARSVSVEALGAVRSALVDGGWRVFERPGFRCPELRLPGSAEEVLAGLSKKMRKNLQYCIRRADRDGVFFRFVSSAEASAEELGSSLESLVRLHRMRFAQREGDSAFLSPDVIAFHKQLCASISDRDELVLFTEAVSEGEVVGSLYGFCSSDRFSFFQHGFDPRFSYISLGSLLVEKTIEHAIGRKLVVFDFLRGGEAYKSRWTSSSQTDTNLAAGRGLAGRLMLESIRLRRAMKRGGKLQGAIQRLRGLD